MTPPAPPPIKSLPAREEARPAASPPDIDRGQRLNARPQAVLSGSDPHTTGDGRHPIAWLHITAPRGAIPTATSKCCCGRDRSAIGRTKVLALIEEHEDHRATCPWSHPAAHETRKAS